MRQHRLAWAGRDQARARQVIKDFMGIDPREAGRPVVRWDARAAVNFVNIFTAALLHVLCRGPRHTGERVDSALLLGFLGTFESGQPQSPEQEGDAFTVLRLNLEKDTASAFRSAGQLWDWNSRGARTWLEAARRSMIPAEKPAFF